MKMKFAWLNSLFARCIVRIDDEPPSKTRPRVSDTAPSGAIKPPYVIRTRETYNWSSRRARGLKFPVPATPDIVHEIDCRVWRSANRLSFLCSTVAFAACMKKTFLHGLQRKQNSAVLFRLEADGKKMDSATKTETRIWLFGFLSLESRKDPKKWFPSLLHYGTTLSFFRLNAKLYHPKKAIFSGHYRQVFLKTSGI